VSYLFALYKTYNNNLDKVGIIETKNIGKKTIEYTLLPISHTTQTAHIEVIVTADGEFYDARVIKENTILPFTEESGSRSGTNYVPHVLHDKLMFVAGDYVKYTGQEDKASCFEDYIQQLRDWCESEYSHPDIVAIYNYVKKGTLIEDLVQKNILYLDEQRKLLKKWDSNRGKEKPEIFSAVTGDQESAFVRFDVHYPNQVHDHVWNNKEIYDLYSRYYDTKLRDKDLCYVSGEYLPAVERHPNKLRNSADKAKLISANDTSGFTFRGRFHNSREVANISYEVSQKAHNALKWLIDKQGKTVDGRVFLAWGLRSPNIPQATEDILEDLNIYLPNLFEIESSNNLSGTREALARKYNQLLSGINKNFTVDENDEVYVMTLDAATPGRLAVLYFRNLHINVYFERLKEWHIGCSWKHRRKVDGELKEFYGSPSFQTIAKYAYGPRPSEKLIKTVMERLLPCVIDGRAIPMDIVQNAIQRASNPVAFNEEWEWEQALSVACSLVKKNYEKEEYSVALDRANTDRDYLFGRLLAVADVLERNALSEADQKRATNAVRYMNAFVRAPLRTWHTIHQNLHPYLMRLGAKARRYTDLFQEINDLFNPNDYNDKPLSGKYLLGYYSQRQDLYTKKEGVDEE
jgi:CRISPR-associated protein Csd1